MTNSQTTQLHKVIGLDCCCVPILLTTSPRLEPQRDVPIAAVRGAVRPSNVPIGLERKLVAYIVLLLPTFAAVTVLDFSSWFLTMSEKETFSADKSFLTYTIADPMSFLHGPSILAGGPVLVSAL